MGNSYSFSLTPSEIKNYLNIYYQNLTLLPKHKIRGNQYLICNKCHSTNLSIIKPNLEWKCNFCDNLMNIENNNPSIIPPHITESIIIPKIYAYFRNGYASFMYDLTDYNIIEKNGHPFDENVNFESFRNEMISYVPYIKEKYANLDLINQYSPDNYIHKDGLFYDVKKSS